MAVRPPFGDVRGVLFTTSLAVVSLGVLAGIASQVFVFGSVQGKWVYPYVATATHRTLFAALVAMPLVVLLSRTLSTEGGQARANGWPSGPVATLLATALAYVLHAPSPRTFAALVSSKAANSFLTASKQVGPLELLHATPDELKRLPIHAASNMPGKTLLFHVLSLVADNPEAYAFLVVVLSSVGVPLVYAIAKRLHSGPTVASTAAVLYALLPSRLVFLPILNTVSPVFILASFWLFLRFLEDGRRASAVWLGVSLWLAFAFEPTPFAAGTVFVAVGVGWVVSGRTSWRSVAWLGLAPLTMLAVDGLSWLGTGFSAISHFQLLLADTQGFNVKAGRADALWLGPNLREFLVATGPAVSLVVLGLVVALAGGRRMWRKLSEETRAFVPVAIGAVVSFALLLWLGVNRGEVERLWIFLGGFWCLAAAPLLAGRDARAPFVVTVAALAVQVALLHETVGFVRP